MHQAISMTCIVYSKHGGNEPPSDNVNTVVIGGSK
jgi:hypothetical protein